MRLFLILTTLFLLPACGVIMINENEYRSLNYSDKQQVKQFDGNIIDTNNENQSHIFIYEINSNNIFNCIKKFDYTWIHLWKPFCPNEQCQNINYYADIEKEYKKYNLQLLLVSETYDLISIKDITQRSNYNKPVFVLQDSVYGHKIRPARLKLLKELAPKLNSIPKYGFEDFLFQDTLLLFAGNNLDKVMIDSIIRNNL